MTLSKRTALIDRAQEAHRIAKEEISKLEGEALSLLAAPLNKRLAVHLECSAARCELDAAIHRFNAVAIFGGGGRK